MCGRLSRAMFEMESRSDAVLMQCADVMQQNNGQLKSALQMVIELQGVVKHLKRREQELGDVIAELKKDKSVLNDRLDSALEEIFKFTGNRTFTMQERLVITPRHTTPHSTSFICRHPYGSITMTTAGHD